MNGLVDTYSDEGLKVNFERTAHVSDWLEKQLDTLKQDAADSQRQLADYQKAHNIVGADENSNLTLADAGAHQQRSGRRRGGPDHEGIAHARFQCA